MPFNGTGMFVRVRNWVADAAAGVKIRADYHDIEDDGFAAGLSQCITRDGQSTVMQNIPMNGKRLTALSDPVDPQDTATKAYADTKMPLAGGTMNGPLTVTGSIGAFGYRTRPGVSGAFGANLFNFNWTGNLQVWVDDSNIGDLATTAYVENRASAWAHAIADPKVNRAGDTITGGLQVNGAIDTQSNIYYFQYSGYLQWNGGGTYTLGGGGTVWHTGNISPVTNGRFVNAGTASVSGSGYVEVAGAAITGAYAVAVIGPQPVTTHHQYRYIQLLSPAGWFTIGWS